MKDVLEVQKGKVDILGNKLFYRYRAGSSEQFLCFLHGYPTSSLDYEHLFEGIPDQYHVLVHDQLGFGNSDKPLDNEYLLTFQADLTCALYKHFNAQNIHLITHDYGTSVATEIIARDNENKLDFNINTVTLCNGSMLIEMSQLRIIQKLLKNKLIGGFIASLTSSSTFHRNMRNIWFDKSLYNKKEMHEHWDLLISSNGKKVLPMITRYIDQRYENYERWIGGLKKSKLPFHILWAEKDPVAIVDMAYKLDSIIEDSRLTIIHECGHYPMIEKDKEWLRLVLEYIEAS